MYCTVLLNKPYVWTCFSIFSDDVWNRRKYSKLKVLALYWYKLQLPVFGIDFPEFIYRNVSQGLLFTCQNFMHFSSYVLFLTRITKMFSDDWGELFMKHPLWINADNLHLRNLCCKNAPTWLSALPFVWFHQHICMKYQILTSCNVRISITFLWSVHPGLSYL